MAGGADPAVTAWRDVDRIATSRGRTATDLAVLLPDVLGPEDTVGHVRLAFARGEKVKMALVVDSAGVLLTTVVRSDLDRRMPSGRLARTIGTLAGRTVRAEMTEADALVTLSDSGTGRSAVVDAQGLLVGLICLKASGLGYCSDEGIAARRGAMQDVLADRQ